MKKSTAIRNGIGLFTLLGVLNSYGSCFDFQSGPTGGSPVTSQVEVKSSCSNGGCPYAVATPETCTVSSTVAGQTMIKYSLSASGGVGGSAAPAHFGLSAGWETQTINGSSGTATKTWNNWCVAHNADTAKTTVTSTILHWTNCNGTPSNSWSESLTTVTAFFARAAGVPDEAQPSPCDPKCPPQG